MLRGEYSASGFTPSTSVTKGYAADVNYQHYFPLIKKLYAYAGGKGLYSNNENQESPTSKTETNVYGASAYGGISWFAFKHFAFETSLLSADFGYSKARQEQTSGTPTSSVYRSFTLSSQGAINNLGFKIYFLF